MMDHQNLDIGRSLWVRDNVDLVDGLAAQAAAYASTPAREAWTAPREAAGCGTALHRWAEAMSSSGRRQATAVAASKLRAWVNRTHGDRPSRGEIRAWVELVLNDRRTLFVLLKRARRERDEANEIARTRQDHVDRLRDELDAVATQRDSLVEALDEAKVERAKLEDALAERDATPRNEGGDLVAELLAQARAGDEAVKDRAALRNMLERTQCERDGWHAQAIERDTRIEKLRGELEGVRRIRDSLQAQVKGRGDAVRRLQDRNEELRQSLRDECDRVVSTTKAYEEMRAAYEDAEAERNRLARMFAQRGEALDDERAARIAAERRLAGELRPAAEEVAVAICQRMSESPEVGNVSVRVDEDRSIVVAVERRFTIGEFRRTDFPGAGAK